MITCVVALVIKFLIRGEDEDYVFCLATAIVDGLILWMFIGKLLGIE